ncbi:hypothetical protein KP509_06G043900 [Ceratopteris richardii]|uniref:Electron transfer flavoprotein alpha/beta-subunit N-terminal domain-containing protein n=1 Tax=Ceratopteris richardii TaxID=49495 RepID=A0A8T2UKC5_CERRI|nr:hypothetical protein KP509_06G043900 [Ceratopteris richardii]
MHASRTLKRIMQANSFRNRMSFLRSFPGRSGVYNYISTLVIAEHDGGSLKESSLNALAAATTLGEKNTISLLVAGSNSSSLDSVAKQAFAVYPSAISKVKACYPRICGIFHRLFSQGCREKTIKHTY